MLKHKLFSSSEMPLLSRIYWVTQPQNYEDEDEDEDDDDDEDDDECL